MLVLSRKQNQNIVIDGRIIIKVVRLDKDVVKLGIEAPASISVHRQEVFEEIERCNKNALQSGSRSVPQLKGRQKNPAET
jgi:carbon storage regulator